MPDHPVVHTPGRPEDLPPPGTLWRHGALGTLVHAFLGEPTDEWLRRYWLTDDRGLGYDDGGGNWWNLKPLPEGRAVLYGEDHEMSKTRWHEPPVDLVEGVPDWLPRGYLRSMDDMLGYVYWFDGASWNRVPYPDGLQDDGLRATAGRYLTEDQALYEATELLEGEPFEGAEDVAPRVIRALLEAGSQRRLTQDLLRDLLNDLHRSFEYGEEQAPPSFDVAAAFDVARRAGFTPDLLQDLSEPAGRPDPVRRRARSGARPVRPCPPAVAS